MGMLDKFKTMLAGSTSKRVDVDARFEIMRQAVSGTMSSFRKARDKENDRIVGLKVCDRDKTDLFEQRFRGLGKPSEGEIAFSIKHPRVVETFEYGQTTRGEQYIVMEFLEGPGLQQLILHRDPRLEGRRAALITQMAEAIDAVHQAGYIHRDICPRNFICSPELDSLKLIDFGLTLPAKREFMQPGNRTGTPLYMSPEVVRRKWTDQRVDIFSFGVTAYYLCALDLPWPVRETTGIAALAHDTQAPTDIFEYCPRLNRRLGKLIMQCMSVRPEDRPESAELLRQLRLVEQDEE
jgi:eukaryotic-like serine/threonine-protein kinase